jgi:hypothetical protein
MSGNQYPNSGKLSHNKYKTEGDKKPNWTGEITMERSTLRELLDEHTEDGIVIKLSGWDMAGQFGPWMRLSWNNYKPQPKEGGYAPAPKPAAKAPPPADDDDSDVPF